MRCTDLRYGTFDVHVNLMCVVCVRFLGAFACVVQEAALLPEVVEFFISRLADLQQFFI